MPKKNQRNPPSNEKKKEYKGRDIVADLYTDNEKHVAVIAKMLNQEEIEFYYILHDMDVYTALDYGEYICKHEGNLPSWNIGDPKKEHWHCCFHCSNPRYASGLAYEIGLHDEDVHLFQRCNDSVKYAHYLFHDPLIWKEKHQYPIENVKGNITGMNRFRSLLKKDINYEDDRQYERIFDWIDTNEKLSIQKFTKWLIKEGLVSFYEKHNRVIKPYFDAEMHKQEYSFRDDDVQIMNIDNYLENEVKA